MEASTGAVIDRSIYPMPMFVSWPVRDLEVARRCYHAAGFITLASIPGPDGRPQLLHFRREKYQDLLVREGRAMPGTTGVTFAAGQEDLHALADRLRASPDFEGTLEGPHDTAWFTTDLVIIDPDGNRMVLTAPRMADIEAGRAWLENATGEFRS